MAINGRTKGSDFERKIAKKLSDWSGMELRRTPLSGGFSQTGSSYTGDINAINREDNFGFHIECKKQEGWTLEQLFSPKCKIWKWWEQCLTGYKTTYKIPLLIFSKNRANTFLLTRSHMLPHTFLDMSSYMEMRTKVESVIICPLNQFLEKVAYEKFH